MVLVSSSDDNEGGASNDDVKDDDGGDQDVASEDGTWMVQTAAEDLTGPEPLSAPAAMRGSSYTN